MLVLTRLIIWNTLHMQDKGIAVCIEYIQFYCTSGFFYRQNYTFSEEYFSTSLFNVSKKFVAAIQPIKIQLGL